MFVDIFFMNAATKWQEEGAMIHLNSGHDPVKYQRFTESKIHVVVLPLKGHKANQTKFQAVMQENARKWQAPGGWSQKEVRKLSYKYK